MKDLSVEFRRILRNFKVLISDADGVLFDGNESRTVMPDGKVVITKRRYFPDGQGLSFLRAIGIRIVFATGEGHPLESIIQKINANPSTLSGDWAPVDFFTGELNKGGKVASLEGWLDENGFGWDDCVYIGDDRTDVEAMQLAALKVTPHDGQRIITRIADIILTRDGGRGAIRELAELVLDVRGIDEATLATA